MREGDRRSLRVEGSTGPGPGFATLERRMSRASLPPRAPNRTTIIRDGPQSRNPQENSQHCFPGRRGYSPPPERRSASPAAQAGVFLDRFADGAIVLGREQTAPVFLVTSKRRRPR